MGVKYSCRKIKVNDDSIGTASEMRQKLPLTCERYSAFSGIRNPFDSHFSLLLACSLARSLPFDSTDNKNNSVFSPLGSITFQATRPSTNRIQMRTPSFLCTFI